VPASGLAISPEAKEFIEILKALEPVHCEKRKLRREIALAEAEKREPDAKQLRERFAKLDAEPRTAKLERRLAELEPRIQPARNAEDLSAISRQQREAFYRCD
jgi:hypothetical protein